MTREFETELRQAFTQRATSISSEALDRLRQVDYRPRTSRLSSPLKVSALTGAATAGTIASIVILGGAQPAFAGWSQVPRSASGAPDATVATNCQQRLDAMPGISGPSGSSGWDAVVTDVRGPFAIVIYQDGGAYATCFSGPSFTVLNRHSANGDSMTVSGSNGSHAPSKGSASSEGTTSAENAATGSTEIGSSSVSHLSLSGEGAYTLVEGEVQPGVTHVTLVRDSGGNVDATTGDGWFVAWWPGSQGVTSAQITTAAGTTTQPLTMPSPSSPPGTGSCDIAPPTSPSQVMPCGAGQWGAVPNGTFPPSAGGSGSGPTGGTR
ncbi:MAG: hypothetical protein ABSC30_12540 [Acidimicrobiales bacterium]|jgi:hypothetical protein